MYNGLYKTKALVSQAKINNSGQLLKDIMMFFRIMLAHLQMVAVPLVHTVDPLLTLQILHLVPYLPTDRDLKT